VDDTGLHRGIREHGGDGVREAFEAVDDGQEDILDAAVLQLIRAVEVLT
jgi:hypothetical protein